MVHPAIRNGQNVAALAPPAVPFVGTAYDPATKSPLIGLSGANLITSLNSAAGGIWQAARGVSPAAAGKFHWEVTYSSGAVFYGIGLTESASFNNVQFPGQNADSIGCSHGGAVFINNVGIGTCDAMGVGQTLEFETDLALQLLWLRLVGNPNWNQNPAADPTTGVGGFSFAGMTGPFAPAAALLANPSSMTSNFGSTPMIGVVSAGYVAGWPL